jgi:DNA-binding NtrC family response regulator
MKTFLIIDDEIYTRDHLGKIIERQGFRALTAGTGEDGIRIYKDNKPDYVLLDVLLPGIDGEDVFKYIKEIDPGANIFFITGCDNIFSVENAIKAGARGFLTKPIFVDDIMKLLNTLETHKQLDFFNPES